MMNFKKMRALVFAAALTVLAVKPAFAATYKVAQGDSLFTIGRLFNTTSATLMSTNHLSTATIYPGQALNVPATAYTVKSGDSLYLIAKKYGVTLDALKKANAEWDNVIYPGQTIIIPGGTAAVTKTAVAATTLQTSAGVVPYTASDVNLLARLITAEAEGQPYSAKVAVGAVVINRVQDPRFANTISGVVYEKLGGYYQFTPVVNGMINKPASADAIKAANEALRGADPTNGAVFYFDDSTTNTWLWSKPVAIRIDNMVFTY